MGAQFEHITYASEVSLTLIVDDTLRRCRQSLKSVQAEPMDLVAWLNALQRQSAPLIHSKAARLQLEAWLDDVDQHITTEAQPIVSLPAP